MRRYSLIPLMVLLLWLAAGLSVSAESAARVDVLAAAAETTGMVRVDFTARSAGGMPVVELTAANLEVSESASDLSLSVEPLLPVTLLALVDLSVGSNAEAIRNTLQAYIEHYFEPRDTLILYILDGADNTPRVAEVNSVEAGRLVLGSIQGASNRYYDLKPTCDLMQQYIESSGITAQRPIHILHVGSFLNSPDLSIAGARMFADMGVPYHGVQAHSARPTGNFQRMVNAGSGVFVNNENGAYVLADGAYTPINNLLVLFETVKRARHVYTLHYRPTNPPQAEPRTVEMTVRLPDSTELLTSFVYQWNYQPPVVAFADASQLNPQRAFIRREGDEIGFDIAVQPLSLSVTYPDGTPRALRSIQLQVIDPATGVVLQTTSLPVEPSTDSTYIVPWSLADFDAPASTTEVELIITVEDELGYTAQVRQRAQVDVSPLPPTATPRPTLAPVVTESAALGAAQVATADALAALNAAVMIGTQSAAQNINDAAPQPTSAGSASLLWLILLLVAALVLLVALAAVLLLRARRLEQQLKAAQAQRGLQPVTAIPAVPNPDDNQFDTQTGYHEPTILHRVQPAQAPAVYARLLVRKGGDGLDKRVVEVNKSPFIIGRASDADFRIDLPYISPKHCAVRWVDNTFQLRDMGSINGTFVNGERIESGREVGVPNGSEIGVTKNITLEIWDMHTDITYKLSSLPPGLRTETMQSHDLVFKPLPGLDYQPDDGDPINDQYSPV